MNGQKQQYKPHITAADVIVEISVEVVGWLLYMAGQGRSFS